MVAPAGRIAPETAARVMTLARDQYGPDRLEITFHPQCFESDGHFAGNDDRRAAAFLQIANDPDIDALWWARGGYGAGRLIEQVLPGLKPEARAKTYLGYSDAGALLAALYGQGFEHLAHGPMANDLVREGGETAVLRTLSWLVDRDPEALEPAVRDSAAPVVAFNLAVLASLMGTPWAPPLDGRVLMLEEVSEHLYRIDRLLFQVTSSPEVRKIAGLRLGRCSDIPPNDPEFGMTPEALARYWCDRAGIAFLGTADIGHDIANKVVPFGRPKA